MEIFWHRRDLRVADNTALSRASEPLPVFVLDPSVLEHASPPRVAFLLEALRSLRDDYRELGGDLPVGQQRLDVPLHLAFGWLVVGVERVVDPAVSTRTTTKSGRSVKKSPHARPPTV